MSLTEKFKKDVPKLWEVAQENVYLDVKSKLFKKLKKYYESEGRVFSGDIIDDYDILLDYLYEDLAPKS